VPSHEDIAHQRAQLDAHRRRLATLLRQLAGIGELHASPGLLGDIREARGQIARIKDILRAWRVMVEELPDDLDPLEATVPARRMRVFISYKHDVAPDTTLAKELAAALSDNYDVFIDTDLVIGVRWAERIKVELARSDALIALLSARATESEMVREEIEFAHALYQAQHRPLILPVRVVYHAPFPYPLNEYLDALHWAFWNSKADTSALLSALRRALAGGGLPPQSDTDKARMLTADTEEAAPASMAQMPSSSRVVLPLEQPEGTMPVDSRLYIERMTDRLAIESMRQIGTTLTIKGPRQMGKSSLLLRAIDAASVAGKHVALLDFQLFNQAALRDADMFFRQFCALLSDAFDIEDKADDYWSAQLGNSQRCTRYVERYLLKEIDAPLLLAMDEVDKMFDAEFRSDFFGMLRGWHNSRAAKPAWRRLDLALVTSTEPYQLIANLNQSPFNVGQVVTLDDFTPEEVQLLNNEHGAPLTMVGVGQLIQLLGGHPYLTRKALYLLANGRSTPAALFAETATKRGPFGDHLRYHLFRLHGQPELIQGLLQVLQHGRCADEIVFWRLHGAGLVRGEPERARARNQLYATFFGTHLKR
jgi:hypothetical protein